MGITFGPKGNFDRLESARLIVEVAEIVVHEADEPHPLAHLLHTDGLARKDLTQIHLPLLEADAATVRHRGRPEGNAVIRADGLGQAEFSEDALEHGKGVGFACARERFTGQQIWLAKSVIVSG